MEYLVVFVPSLPHPLLSTVYQCDRCLSSRGHGGSWLGCQVLPANVAVSILELAANNGSSRMSQAPNLHRAMQLLTYLNTSLIIAQDYIAVKEKYATYLPHTAGRYAAKRFRKAQVTWQ